MKLNPAKVQQIRACLRERYTHRSIAITFGVSESHIGAIADRNTWKKLPHVEVPVPQLPGSKLTRFQVDAALDAKQVQEIRDLRRAGYSQRSIAAHYELSQTMVCDIISGKNYGYVPDVPGPLPKAINQRNTVLKLARIHHALTPQRVQQVRTLLAMNYSAASVGRVLDVHHSTLNNIAKGYSWDHLPNEPADVKRFIASGKLKTRTRPRLASRERIETPTPADMQAIETRAA